MEKCQCENKQENTNVDDYDEKTSNKEGLAVRISESPFNVKREHDLKDRIINGESK